jgi:DNA-directed RNA polymerase specialized sigma24 family protein
MEIEGLTNASDHELHRLGIRMARVLNGQESTDNFARDVARGDAAYRILYDRYADRLFGFVRDEVLFADEYQELAEDTVQAVFLQLWQRDEPTAPGVELWGLLRCWAHDRARDLVRTYAKLRTRRARAGAEHRRRQFNNTLPGRLDAAASRDGDPAGAARELEVADADLARLLAELPEEERRLVEDHYLKQVPIDQLIDRVQAPGEDRAAGKRRVYQALHRFRTRVRRRHPLTAASVDAAVARLERVLAARAIDAGDQLEGLRLEREVRGDDRALLADMLVAVSRVRKRIARGKKLDGAISWLDDLVFRLGLRTGAANLPGLVQQELGRAEEHLSGREADCARELRPLLGSLHARELVAAGRQLRRITGWLRGPRQRGVDALEDLLLEMRLRRGGAVLDAACRGIQERLLARIVRPALRRQARELLPPHDDAGRWRRLLKLVLRAERGKQAWTDEQVLAGVKKIRGD